MTYEQEFMQEFEAWIATQIMVNEMAMNQTMCVLKTQSSVTKAGWMPINFYQANLRIIKQAKASMTYLMVYLIKLIID